MGSPLHPPQPAWPARDLPVVEGPVWAWDVIGVEQLAGIRAQVRGCMQSAAGPDANTAAGERLLLIVEELTSNALRHGEAPVHTALTVHPEGWLLVVTDGAGDRPPIQAIDRDPAEGGLGLQLAAILSSTHGWVTEGTRKHVWAYLPHQPGELPRQA